MDSLKMAGMLNFNFSRKKVILIQLRGSKVAAPAQADETNLDIHKLTLW